MRLEDYEKAFATVLSYIKCRDDGADFVPIARKLEAAIHAQRANQTDLERYRGM